MVNYDSIKVGLEVEFMIDNHIFDGVVRYKGGINGYDGLWIGVEANQPSTIEPIIALIFFISLEQIQELCHFCIDFIIL